MAIPEFPFSSPEEYLFTWNTFYFMAVVAALFWLKGYMGGRPCTSTAKLNGKTVIVTGANSGIGFETAKDLVRRRAHVILACRDETKGKQAEQELRNLSKSYKATYMNLDLASFDSIRNFVEEFCKKEDNLHILVNNAGIMMLPQQKSKDGNEMHFQVNYLGHFLLTQLLLDRLKASAPSRIVCVSAVSYKLGDLDLDDLNIENRDYIPGTAYSSSKLAIIYWVRKLSALLEGSDVTINAVNPGIVRTEAHRHMPFASNGFLKFTLAPMKWLIMKDASAGSQTSIHCCVAEELDRVSGQYFTDCTASKLEEVALHDDKMEALWKKSLEMTKLEKQE